MQDTVDVSKVTISDSALDEASPAVAPRHGGMAAALQSTGGRVVFTLVNVLTGLLTARALHPEGRGELAAMGVWPNFLPNLITLGIPSALIFRLRQTPGQSGSLVRAALYLTLVLGAIATAFGIVAMPFWLSNYSAHTVHLAQLFMLNSTVVLLIAMMRALCESRGDFVASGVSFGLTPLVTAAVLVGLNATRRLTPGPAALAYVLGGIPTVFFLVGRAWNILREPASAFLANSRLLLSYGLRSYGVDLCGTLSLYADQALVVRLLSPSAMGIYVVALSLSRMLNIIQASVASVLFPRTVNVTKEVLLGLTARAARISFVLAVAAGLCVALLGPVVLPLLYGSEYRGVSRVLDVLIAEAILTGATLVLTQAFMARGRPGLVTILQSSGIVLSIPLLLLLIPRFGIMGASVSLLVASLLRLLLTILCLHLYLQMPARDLIPRKDETVALLLRLARRFSPQTAH